ncbi:MAG: asparagine synthase (glutamine-hydrolyzing) [Gammaproteobacteria bacterium]|nr:asparagine synthase (glutamine-hydrolyzing) [Gammaproteobacteria bacterium]
MCGIAGIAGEVTPELAAAGHVMINRLQHRGPDDDGWLTYSRNGTRTGKGRPPVEPTEAVLLHRRLSILDLSEAGHQPMTSFDGRFHIVFNGEIYNYLELRNELRAAGFTFRTETDTEVLLAAFAHWNSDCLQRLVGMFAFVILDSVARKLFLARDFFGIKPLYYSQTPSRLAFASEIKALLELPDVARQVNPQTLYHYFSAGLTDFNEETLLREVRQLPPAHYLVADLDESRPLQPVCYWRVNIGEPDDLPFDEAALRLRQLFLESIKLHMRSHVTVGVALSGGIDSTAIAMSMRHMGNASQQLHAFSYITDDKATNDEAWIDLAASASSATVHKVRSTPEGFAGDIDGFITAQDEPTGGPSTYSHYLVCQRARHAGVKVVLDGHGADELFAGYNDFFVTRFLSLCSDWRIQEALRLYRHASTQPNLGKSMRRIGTRVLPPWLRNMFRRNNHLLDPAWFEQHDVDTRRPPWAASSAYTTRTLLHEILFRTQNPMQLRYGDRNAMAFGVENRVPFLTPKIVEFVSHLPEEYLISANGTRKNVLRAALRGIVPDIILDREDKIGFQRPHQSSMMGLRPYVEKILSGDVASRVSALNFNEVQKHWSEVLADRRPFDYSAWRWINLIRWAEITDVKFD